MEYPSIKQSGSTLRFGRLIKHANNIIKCALVEASWVAVRTKGNNPLKKHYNNASKGNKVYKHFLFVIIGFIMVGIILIP